eukprot:TRINITY_DN93709_c0_g1_i1.p1 TRINITY_DN93709_c0_g1~~TRINITY_DN93709_c0_g1_i1.p1  ORF type:complete len:174 (-),score=31.11 TRINITY_DN93709_c0_g1_i1:483-941(-)
MHTAAAFFGRALATALEGSLLACYDRSGWPFRLNDILENFVRLTNHNWRMHWSAPSALGPELNDWESQKHQQAEKSRVSWQPSLLPEASQPSIGKKSTDELILLVHRIQNSLALFPSFSKQHAAAQQEQVRIVRDKSVGSSSSKQILASILQ